jgi:mono/diheme cytochrome c family protein
MKNNQLLLLLLLTLVGIGNLYMRQPPTVGENLYKKHCRQCHGTDGTKGMFGAKNLKASTLSSAAILLQVQEGKGWMPSFKKKFNAEELSLLVEYVKTLRQN